ncbi:MAG: hypothetical protein GEU91_10105 [Rhizobiales bacterium]|nr:hypothetical protein [Hyphomicrobiales bacterium]
MREYHQCRNIIVDGDEFTEGALGLDWFPSAASSQAKQKYETGILDALERLRKTWAGWSVITEIFQIQSRKMYIRPYHATAGQCNATAKPTNVAAATLKGTTALDSRGNLPAPGQPRVIGTGSGSDTIINFSPETFQAGSVCATGPGATADEILLHEMVHGLRHMGGRAVREGVTGNPNMTNYEEFVAILVSNIFRSEKGIPNLRADHAGFNPLTGPNTNPATFVTSFRQYISHMSIEQPRMVQNLRTAGGVFNPLKHYP